MSTSVKRFPWIPVASVAGGAGLLGVGIWGAIKNSIARTAVEKAVAGTDGKGGTLTIRITGYWPFSAREDEKKMEGGIFDRKMPSKFKNDPNSAEYKAHVLHTVEDYLAGKAAFASLSGDDAVWPYGQKLTFPWTDGRTIVGRVVDTGRNFRGSTKVYRALGAEPIDVCVASAQTVVPKPPIVTARIIPGDNFDKGKAVATSGIRNQTVAGYVDTYTSDDRDALARMIESEQGSSSRDEKLAAGWATRNRAAMLGVSVRDLLVPEGEYGPQGLAGGRVFASTRREPTGEVMKLAAEILDASESTDPTDGAVDFWEPAKQDKLKMNGDFYRVAKADGNTAGMRELERFRGYTQTESEVRAGHRREGLDVVKTIGMIELLGYRRMS